MKITPLWQDFMMNDHFCCMGTTLTWCIRVPMALYCDAGGLIDEQAALGCPLCVVWSRVGLGDGVCCSQNTGHARTCNLRMHAGVCMQLPYQSLGSG